MYVCNQKSLVGTVTKLARVRPQWVSDCDQLFLSTPFIIHSVRHHIEPATRYQDSLPHYHGALSINQLIAKIMNCIAIKDDHYIANVIKFRGFPFLVPLHFLDTHFIRLNEYKCRNHMFASCQDDEGMKD